MFESMAGINPFGAETVHFRPMGAPQIGFCVLLTETHWTLQASLLTGTRCLKATLYLPCNSHGISHFWESLWYLLLRNDIHKLKFACYGCSLLLGYSCFEDFSMDRAKKNVKIELKSTQIRS